jgi:hypothetical protein
VGEPSVIVQPGVESGRYKVRNFFSALHIILLSILPPERELKEYTLLFITLQRLLARVIDQYRTTYRGSNMLQIPTIITLSVFLPSSSPPQIIQVPKAVIGFSMMGADLTRKEILKERHENLPFLAAAKRNRNRPGDWPVGNCGEAETFAYTYRFPRGRASNSFRLILVNLSLELMAETTTPVRVCQQCKEVLTSLRERYPLMVSLDLAPQPKRANEG